MSFSHREVELFSLWAKRAEVISIMGLLKIELAELNAQVDKIQKIVNKEKKEGE